MRNATIGMSRVGSFSCSNQLGEIIRQGLNEIIGYDDTHDILKKSSFDLVLADRSPQQNTSIPYRQISRIQQTMETLFGERGGKGLSLRAGQAAFRYGLREMGWSQKLCEPRMRLLPPHQKLAAGASYLAKELSSLSDQKIHIEAGRNTIDWIVEDCPLCWGRHTNENICHHTIGFLQEFVSWTTGGKPCTVTECECLAAGGSNCVFTIETVTQGRIITLNIAITPRVS